MSSQELIDAALQHFELTAENVHTVCINYAMQTLTILTHAAAKFVLPFDRIPQRQPKRVKNVKKVG